jgi:hypothetical protein
VVADRLSLRWYVGYDLHEPLPDHSSLTKIRERYGLEIFRDLFERIVEMCFEAGLVRSRERFFGSTKIEADAAVDSLAARWFVEAHLHDLFEGDDVRRQKGAEDSQETEEEIEAEGAVRGLPTAGDEYIDLVRTYMETKPYQKAIRKRKVWIEPLFAEGKLWHGMRRFRTRTLKKVNVEALMTATGQNVKRLLLFGRRGPEELAQAAALRPPAGS